ANPLKPQTVKLNGTNIFNSNQGLGLSITSIGAITVNNLQASNSATLDGADIDNSTGGSKATVTLTGASLFQNNHVNGLSIQSAGAITTNNLTANCNGFHSGCSSLTGIGNGVQLDNHNAATPQKVSVLGTANAFNNNYGDGLYIQSKGAITTANVTAEYSFKGNGVNIDNSGAGSVGSVSVTGTNTFIGNDLDGLSVASLGAITANNLTANCNGSNNCTTNLFGYDGVYLNNSGGTLLTGITLTGFNMFENNATDGLFINSSGKVSLTKIYADNNASDGLDLTAGANSTVTCGGFTGNDSSGNGSSGISANFIAAHTLTLSGVLSDLNASNNNYAITGGTFVTTARDCPVP
ncbi:MAG: hypothetical protein WBW94_17560, partial [Anaerolineales bacterium]